VRAGGYHTDAHPARSPCNTPRNIRRAGSIYGLDEFGHTSAGKIFMIEVRGLTKYYGEHAAIADLNFSIARGEVIGFLGLNGAGKSTTLKVLGCVLLPTAGVVTVDGIDIARDPHEVPGCNAGIRGVSRVAVEVEPHGGGRRTGRFA